MTPGAQQYASRHATPTFARLIRELLTIEAAVSAIRRAGASFQRGSRIDQRKLRQELKDLKVWIKTAARDRYPDVARTAPCRLRQGAMRQISVQFGMASNTHPELWNRDMIGLHEEVQFWIRRCLRASSEQRATERLH